MAISHFLRGRGNHCKQKVGDEGSGQALWRGKGQGPRGKLLFQIGENSTCRLREGLTGKEAQGASTFSKIYICTISYPFRGLVRSCQVFSGLSPHSCLETILGILRDRQDNHRKAKHEATYGNMQSIAKGHACSFLYVNLVSCNNLCYHCLLVPGVLLSVLLDFLHRLSCYPCINAVLFIPSQTVYL